MERAARIAVIVLALSGAGMVALAMAYDLPVLVPMVGGVFCALAWHGWRQNRR